MACCDEYDKAIEEGRITYLDGDRFLDENIILSACPWCGRIFGKQVGSKYITKPDINK